MRSQGSSVNVYPIAHYGRVREHAGHIAVEIDESYGETEPIRTIQLAITQFSAVDYDWLIGQCPGITGQVRTPAGSYIRFDATGAPMIKLEIPIDPPSRGGRTWQWRYSCGRYGSPRWYRDEYPPCDYCYQTHNSDTCAMHLKDERAERLTAASS